MVSFYKNYNLLSIRASFRSKFCQTRGEAKKTASLLSSVCTFGFLVDLIVIKNSDSAIQWERKKAVKKSGRLRRQKDREECSR